MKGMGIYGLLLLGLLANPLWADETPKSQVCSGELTTPIEAFEYFYAQGLVLHKTTGLLWKMCSESSVYQRKTGECVGDLQLYYWPNAKRIIPAYADWSDWRLPTSREMRQLVEYGCTNPALNLYAFPNTPADSVYWTSTSWMKPTSDRAWVMDFSKGLPDARFKRTGAYVRLVRQPSDEDLTKLRSSR
jgi:hypothetical protein